MPSMTATPPQRHGVLRLALPRLLRDSSGLGLERIEALAEPQPERSSLAFEDHRDLGGQYLQDVGRKL